MKEKFIDSDTALMVFKDGKRELYAQYEDADGKCTSERLVESLEDLYHFTETGAVFYIEMETEEI